ncbi:hypothetical protein KW842_23780 [Duganella sp. sic0402]|uniref:hypothetical protein n=1 Tax=Duganella sp. sic0402 TaxID=2854786 RepID=UPI001C493681|nr:hypothetical protein [Duganella sp. sic0402]MBV7538798.1 hypothetical protein [Duganella sp. sic0402]
MIYRAAPTAVFTALLLACAASSAADTAPPQRASGLWQVTPEHTPFSYEICVQADKDRILEDDVWSGFERECVLESQQRDEQGQRLVAVCDKTTRLTVSMTGDFVSAYKIAFTATYPLPGGKLETQSDTLQGRFAGVCPDTIPPGAKQMKRGPLIKSPYGQR